ncbi:transcriptional regulator [Streptomyces sp. NPDC058947]|uniref:transcriptional regulator n=1 Tax=Streptomyces sp. NPDC058947 TaxID=3346675 RepID=UPI0036A13B06
MSAFVEEDLIQRVLDLLGCRDHATFLRRLAEYHKALGYGHMATRPEKVSRWKRGVRPDRYAEMALASMLGVPVGQVRMLGWPGWLRVALNADQVLLNAPWTPAGALEVLDHLGKPDSMDRRAAILSGGALAAATLNNWTSASAATGVHDPARPHVTDRSTTLIDARLAALRQLDDEIGSAETYALARAERASIVTVLRTRSFSEAVTRRLFSAAAEASRICGWCAFDSGNMAVAEHHYMGAARAAASAQDPVATANLFTFWAMARYSDNDTSGALDYAQEALRHAQRTDSPRLIALAHARTSRAHAKAGDLLASRRSEEAAFTAFEAAGDTSVEPACVYWVSKEELHSWAASNATDLGDPRRALRHYAAIATLRREAEQDTYPRSRALRLVREAKAHLSLRDVDAALHVADQAVQTMGGVTSTRGTTILTGLRSTLQSHRQLPEVRKFLERTA